MRLPPIIVVSLIILLTSCAQIGSIDRRTTILLSSIEQRTTILPDAVGIPNEQTALLSWDAALLSFECCFIIDIDNTRMPTNVTRGDGFFASSPKGEWTTTSAILSEGIHTFHWRHTFFHPRGYFQGTEEFSASAGRKYNVVVSPVYAKTLAGFLGGHYAGICIKILDEEMQVPISKTISQYGKRCP